MPTFSRPETFAIQARSATRSAAAAVDMTGILADLLQNFMTSAAAYTGLSSDITDTLLDDVTIYTDPDELRQAGKPTWIFVTPAPVPATTEIPSTLKDIGVMVTNPSMPPKLNNGFIHTEVGRIVQSQVAICQRSVIVGISMETRAAAFRIGDAVYTWLADMLAILNVEFGAKSVKLSPLQVAGDSEKPLFADFPGDPVVIQIVASSFRRSVYSVPDPP